MTKKEKQGLGDALRASFTPLNDDYTRKYHAFGVGSGDLAGFQLAGGHVLGYISAVSRLARCLDSMGDRFFHDLCDDFRNQFDAVCGTGIPQGGGGGGHED